MTDFEGWLATPVTKHCEASQQQAIARQAVLTKPAGSLGKLEQIAIKLAAMQATATPQISQPHITVYAADHGVMAEGVSAFPQAVTGEMLRNFASGGAAISVLSWQLNAKLDVINLGTVSELEPIAGVQDCRIAAGTANFCLQAAMTAQQCIEAISLGSKNVEQAKQTGADLYIGGDMGIGNTTAATALGCALLQTAPQSLAGPGTGLDKEGIAHKAAIIDNALTFHQSSLDSPFSILCCLGGFEIAALTGSYLQCAKTGLPVVVDGFISSVAALVAEHMCPGSKDWFIFSHQSAEPGHRLIIEAMHAEPLLDLNMRLGEASGAAVVVPLLQMSCALHNQMATFAEAAVSEKLN